MRGAVLLGLLCALAACAPRREGLSLEEAAYSTVYLGPGGEVIADSRRNSPWGRKQRESLPRVVGAQDWFWRGDGVAGSPRIVIRLGEQRAFFYRGDELVGGAPVSTGREGYRTPAGSYRVTQKNIDHASNLYGDYVDAGGNVVVANVGVNRDPRPPGTRFRGAPMPYFMRVAGAVGMHAGYLPGYPASHGCIRLPEGAARAFFENAPAGTPVVITH